MAFDPGVDSLCTAGTHPRLHITPDNLATYRTRFASGDLNTCWTQLITDIESRWSYTLTQFMATSFYFPGDLYALVYLIGAISGDGRTHTIQQYGEKAAEHLMAYCSSYGTAVTLAASGTSVTATGAPTTIANADRVAVIGASNDAFNGFFRVAVSSPGTFTYTATRGTPPASGTAYAYEYYATPQSERGIVLNQVSYCYDWLCGYALGGGDDTAILSSAQRAVVVKHLMDAAENMRAYGSPGQTFWVGNTVTGLFSSYYFESHQLFIPALACWNEQSVNGVADRDSACQTIMDHWETINLSGAGLDAQNWGGEGSDWTEYGFGGATTEIGAYTFDRCLHWDLSYNAMRTSCNGMDYLTGATNYPGTWIRYGPHYAAYMFSPNNIGTASAVYLRTGQSDATSAVTESQSRRSELRILSGINSACGYPRSAGLAKWLLTQWALGDYPTYSYNALSYLICWDQDAASYTATEAGLPHLWHYPRQGVYIRTGFGNDPTATVVWMGCPDYWIEGHSWDAGTGDNRVGNEPHGLMIYKHGPLLLCRGGGLRGPGTHNTKHRNHLVFDDPAIAGDGLRAANTYYTNISQYTPASSKYVGGVTSIFSDTTRRADLVEATTTGMYNPALVSSVTSKWIVFRGADSAKDDYVVEYTACTMQSGKESVPKRWQGNCPYAPTVDGTGWVADSSTRWHSDDGSLITVDNRNWGSGDPVLPALTLASIKGRLFVKPLMPTAKKLYLRGGRYAEFMDETGSSYNPAAGTAQDQAILAIAGQLHCGSHFFLVEATESNATERFLICFQASDSSVVTTARTMDLVSASNLRGAHIQDATNGDKVAIFSYDGTAQTSYSYTITMSAVGGTHLVSGLDSTKYYIVRRNGSLVSPEAGYSAARGALCFSSIGGTGAFTIEQATTARTVHLVVNS